MNNPHTVAPNGSPAPFPRMVLSAPLAGYDVTLAEGANAVIALRALQALPGALFFTLQIFSAPDLELEGRSVQKVPRPEPTPGGFVVDAHFKDDKAPKLTKNQEAHLVSLHRAGQHTTTEIAELFKVARSTVYRIVQRTPEEEPKTRQPKRAKRQTASS